MLQELFLDRLGGQHPATQEKFESIMQSQRMAINLFGEKMPRKGNWHDYRSFFKERIATLERQLANAKEAAALLRNLVIEEEEAALEQKP